MMHNIGDDFETKVQAHTRAEKALGSYSMMSDMIPWHQLADTVMQQNGGDNSGLS